MKKDFKKDFKKFLKDIFAPFIYIWEFILKYYESSFRFFKEHKEIMIILTYGLGLLLQSAFLFFSFGIEGLNFLSFKFSLILLFILLFLGFLGLPIILLFIVVMTLYLLIGLLPLLIIVAVISIILGKLFPNFFKKDKFKNFDKKINWLYVASTFIIFISMGISFISQYSISKPIELLTEKNGKILGDLIFYNQDFYFIKNCDEKIIIPNSEITGIHFLCPLIGCDETKKINIKNLQKNYCDILKNKK